MKKNVSITGTGFCDNPHVFLVFFHRGFKRQRPGTRNSARVLLQQHDPYWDRLRIYKPRWVDRQHPGKNWRRASLIGWVRDESLTVCVKLSLRYSVVLSEANSPYHCSACNPHFLFCSGRPGTVGRCRGEGAIGNGRTAVGQVSAGLPGVPEFIGSPREGPTPGSAGDREDQEGESGGWEQQVVAATVCSLFYPAFHTPHGKTEGRLWIYCCLQFFHMNVAKRLS